MGTRKGLITDIEELWVVTALSVVGHSKVVVTQGSSWGPSQVAGCSPGASVAGCEQTVGLTWVEVCWIGKGEAGIRKVVAEVVSSGVQGEQRRK